MAIFQHGILKEKNPQKGIVEPKTDINEGMNAITA